MTEININGNTLEMYSSMEEMPIVRFNAYNKYVMIDSGIGSDLASVDDHLSNVRRHISKGDMKNADQSLMNMRQNMAFVISGTSPKMNSFVCLIHKINGKVLEDLSEENIEKVIVKLNSKGVTLGIVVNFLNIIKKKLITNLKRYSRNSPEMRK